MSLEHCSFNYGTDINVPGFLHSDAILRPMIQHSLPYSDRLGVKNTETETLHRMLTIIDYQDSTQTSA